MANEDAQDTPETFAAFVESVSHFQAKCNIPVDPFGWARAKKIFDRTVGPALNDGHDWKGDDRRWVLARVKEMADHAETHAGGSVLTPDELEKAIDKVIKDWQVRCLRVSKYKKRGDFCLGY